MSLQGSPDWSQPLHAGGGDLYFAYEEPLRVFAPPLELRVAGEPDGAPALALELIRLSGGPGGLEAFGLLTIRFVSHYALAERQQGVFVEHPDVKVEPLIPRGGFLRFQAAQALDIPAALLEPRPLVWSGAGSLTLAAQLEPASASLLNDALVQGLVVVTAVAEVEAWGLARRVPARVKLNPALVAGLIDGIAVDGKCTPAAVVSLLAGANDPRAIAFGGVGTDVARLAAAQACAERLIGRFAKLAPAGDPAAGAVFAFEAAAMSEGEIAWDLSETVLVPKGLTLASSPLDAARQALADGFKLTRHAPEIQFATGLHVLSIYPNLPPRRVGVLTLSTEVRVPPHPPDRRQTVTGSAVFREGDVSKTIPIRLSPAEPVAFDYQTIAFVTEGGGAKRLTGPALRHEGLHLTIAPGSFPVRFVRVEATAALLDVATLQIHCAGRRGAAPWSASAGLDKATSALAIAVPLDLAEGSLGVTATALDGGRTLDLAPRALEDCWLDLSSFPTAGPRRIEIVCDFDDGAGLAAIECAPEDRLHDASAAGLVRLTPGAAVREWRWLVTNPLRDGYCWRWFRNPGETAAPWSEILDPAAGPLTLKSSARTPVSVPGAAGGPRMTAIELDDVIVTPAGDDPDAFFYTPKAPGIAVDQNGRRQLNVLTAGPVAFLQVTGAWGLRAAEVDALRGRLAHRLGRNPAALRLQPAPDSVDGVALLIGDGEGELTVLQQGRSSGVPPHHAVFNVMLDATQLAKVQEALNGKRHLLALRYDVTRRQPVTATAAGQASARETSGGEEPGRSWSASSAHTETKSTRETTEETTTSSVLLDAADWAG